MNGFGIYTDPGASVTEAGFGGRLPTIGDVVMMKDDAFSGRLGYAAFTTSIIVDIRDHDKYPDAIMIHLARPHMRAEKIGGCRGNATTSAHEFGHSQGINEHDTAYENGRGYMNSPSGLEPIVSEYNWLTLKNCLGNWQCPRPSGFRYSPPPD